MREKLKFGVVDSEASYNAIMKFAKSFPDGRHGLYNMELPIVIMQRGDNVFGFYEQIRHPLVVPAFHPDYTSPRDFKEAMEAINHSQCLASISNQYPNGICYWAVEDAPSVSAEIIDKLGIRDMRLRIHSYKP